MRLDVYSYGDTMLGKSVPMVFYWNMGIINTKRNGGQNA